MKLDKSGKSLRMHNPNTSRAGLPIATDWRIFATNTIDPLLWHNRLGHISYKSLLETQKLVTGLEIATDGTGLPTCEACKLGNSRANVHKTSLSKRVHPGELIHIDHGEFSIPTVNRETGYLLIVDDADHYVEYHAQRRLTANETLDTFKKLEARLEARLSRRIHKLQCCRSDEGTAFGGVFKKYLESRGVKQEFSNRYDHQQNGLVERMHRTLQEKHRAQMEHMQVPIQLQSYSLQYAAYVTNRTYTSTELVTPYEKRTGTKPDVSLSHLRIFYSPAVVHVPKELQSKAATNHGIRWRYLGPSPDHRGNIFINVKTHRIFTSNSATIFEDWKENPTINMDDYFISFDDHENPYDDDYKETKETTTTTPPSHLPKIRVTFRQPVVSSSEGVLNSHRT